ncbi:MAG: hypothetical protein A3I89_03510 [Candidatus Harrisonbacteria bacterium RIFCSPLOWO2_02_FULL_41_11]|uniref:M23ase beta-sheet core domain-containing protein n=1 Tax=Candidatus Harrisonbacteria bacterium RIFCSPHIGHO2_02_FULL_42_16 TaxID=1798404 RepID=A0A1G1ZFF3_9BACT|nr:MAG: hypothetical protein A3B92_03550 [Candidatus Harrisonbacteria bacterium RIFCSPHIGHO2_02_FULL_42_16]OGY66871.1 MAG: hypothetical protein A3I89_03510 [Candidatus Harrisonbacteria bacterium RIFCSPLOWO2_02_FULL_41_11]
MKRIILSAIGFLIFFFVLASGETLKFEISSLKPYQGSVIRIEVPKKRFKKKLKNGEIKIVYELETNFLVRVFDKEYPPMNFEKKAAVFVGIDYRAEPEFYPMEIILVDEGGNKFAGIPKFLSVRKKYPKLNYQPPPGRSWAEQNKIDEESERIQQIFESKSVYFPAKSENFQWPLMPAEITGKFGIKKCWGKKISSCRYHTGTDFRSAFDKFHRKPENVYPINGGIVAEVRDYYLEGKTVIIDHGAGIKSSYFHLSKFYCKKGAIIKKNQPLGRTGHTGMGIQYNHLHLMITINGAVVDPHKFLRENAK